MKTKTMQFVAMFFIAFTTATQAALIDIIAFPEGTLPSVYADWLSKENKQYYFFDSAVSYYYTLPPDPTIYPPGWVSQFGALDGGTYFFTDLFEGDPPAQANVWWDFTGSDYFMRYLTVEGTADGVGWTHLYEVPFNGFRFQDFDTVQINLAGTGTIDQISFYGSDRIFGVPDTGTTMLYLAMGLVALVTVRKRCLN